MAETEIHFRCPRCVGETTAPAAMAGRSVFCRYCGNELIVPAVSERPRRETDPSLLYDVDALPQDTRKRHTLINTVTYTCVLCGTRIVIRANDVGVKRVCPDCETPFVITQAQFTAALQEAKRERCNSWTDPARRLYPESYDAPNPNKEIYGIKGDTEPENSPALPPPVLSENSNASPQHSVKKEENLIRIVCGLCGTIMYAPASELGKKVKCPDCETCTEVSLYASLNPINEQKIEPISNGIYELADENEIKNDQIEFKTD